MSRSVHKFNPSRLKEARIYEGMTITDLANLTGVSKQVISQYEHGKSQPGLETLLQIINVLKFPREYFYKPDCESMPIGATFFRSFSTARKRSLNSQAVKLKVLAEVFDFLSKYIDFPNPNIPKINIQNMNFNDENEIERLAIMVREHWGLGYGPIKNIIHVLEKNGFILTTLMTDEERIDAFSQKWFINGEERCFIVLGSDKQSAVRRQFDAAHELGHLLMHDWITDIEELSHEEYKEVERQADQFAASFLLPKESFLNDLHIPNRIEFYIELKKKWRVSIAAMIIRAYQLKAINYNQYQYLMRQMSLKNMRKKEPLDEILAIHTPVVLNKAIELLLENEIFTPREILDNLALPQDKVEFLLGLEKGTLDETPSEDNTIVKLHQFPRREAK